MHSLRTKRLKIGKRTSAAVALFLMFPFYWAHATNLYVSVAGTNDTPPFTNWSLSCSNIQWVVNASANGDIVYITNGHYYLTNYVRVAKGITLISYNNGMVDPTNTILDGNNYDGKPVTNRCLAIDKTNAVVAGFTLTNGSAGADSQYSANKGGGCYVMAGTLTNCIITGNYATNSASTSGGGVYIYDNVNGVVANCQIIGNMVRGSGGGIYCGAGSKVKDCFIGWNSDTEMGAGVYVGATCMVYNCTIVSNRGMLNGGGAVFIGNLNAVVSNCTIINNSGRGVYLGNNAIDSGNLVTHCSIIGNTNDSNGGGVQTGTGMTIRNCLIAHNRIQENGAGIYFSAGNFTSFVHSCTVVSNSSFGNSGGGICYGGSAYSVVSNTIVCSNKGNSAVSDYDIKGGSTNCFYNSCCKTVTLPPAQGNIQSDPLFVDFTNDNFRLSQNSPCVNTGANQGWMANSIDLDGRRRLDGFSGRPDMGCYEFVPAGTMFKVR